MIEAIVGLLIGSLVTFAAAMFIHNVAEEGRDEGIVAKKEDRDE